MDLLKRVCGGLLLAGLLVAPVNRSFAQPAKTVAEGSQSTPEAQSPEAKQGEEDQAEGYRKSPAVRALGAKLGLNPEQSATAFEAGNFIVLAALLGWLLVKMLPKTFRDRNTAIQKHLVDARTATEEANARLGNVEARLAKLDEQIAGMKAQAEKDAALDEQRIKASVDDERKKILEAADQEIAAATTLARRHLQRYAAELAVEQAERKLTINAETDRLLVQSFARRLGGNDTRGQN